MRTYTTDDGIAVSVRPMATPFWETAVTVKHPGGLMFEDYITSGHSAEESEGALLALMRKALRLGKPF